MNKEQIKTLRARIDLVGKDTNTEDYEYFHSSYTAFDYVLKNTERGLLSDSSNTSLFESFSKLIILKKTIEDSYDEDFRNSLNNPELRKFYTLLLSMLSLMEKNDWIPSDEEKHFLKKTNFKFHLENIYTFICETKQNIKKAIIDYKFDSTKGVGILTIDGKEIIFEDGRAFVLDFFYKKHKLNDEKYFTAHDFKKYIKNGHKDFKTKKNEEIKTDSRFLNKAVNAINDRIKKESAVISVIKSDKEDENENDKSLNNYRWKIKI